jgi:urease accessory protein
MIVERPIGSVGDKEYEGAVLDFVEIEWFNTHKKIDRKTSRGGLEIGLRMDAETARRGWRQGDVLCRAAGGVVIAVEIPPCRCIAVGGGGMGDTDGIGGTDGAGGAPDRRRLARLCYEIGNRHAPFFYDEDGDGFLLPYDEPMKVMLEKLGAAVDVRQARLLAENRVSSASAHDGGHSHGHSHSHSHGENGGGHTHTHDHSET